MSEYDWKTLKGPMIEPFATRQEALDAFYSAWGRGEELIKRELNEDLFHEKKTPGRKTS